MSCNNDCDNFRNNDSCCNNEFDVWEGVRDIRSGLDKCCRAIEQLRCNNIQRGRRLLEECLCCLEQGLSRILDAVEDNFTCDCAAKRLFESGVCCINEGIEDIRRALEALDCGNVCDCIQFACRGMEKVEKGLCCCIRAIRQI